MTNEELNFISKETDKLAEQILGVNWHLEEFKTRLSEIQNSRSILVPEQFCVEWLGED